ncbi:MAG TPA: hypothetical protein DCS76_00645 [Gemmatimonadetes bacterium]|nr:hypothetical protein [Gemmatimonadota bacterium]
MTRYEKRLLDNDGQQRLGTILVSTMVSLVSITVAITVAYHLVSPEHGWVSAFGVGGLVGVWTCVLPGGVAGNGIHEWRRARRAD